MTEHVQTVRVAPAVYHDGPAPDDPAETYHEASKLSPATAAYELAGAVRLLESSELRSSAARSVRRHPLADTVPLPERAALDASLGSVLGLRRSTRSFSHEALTQAELGSLLHAAYGVTGVLSPDRDTDPVQTVRSVPSGGALYPLELFVVAEHVTGVTPGVHHFDPLADCLERVPHAEVEPAAVSPYARELSDAAVAIVIAATFWRSRFKYGLRAYRFTLLEAGHVAQNLLLAATALGLASFPLGGFYDRRLDDALGLDGVDESSLVMVCVGRPLAAP